MFVLQMKLYEREYGELATHVEQEIGSMDRIEAINITTGIVRKECQRGLYYFQAILLDDQTICWEASTLDSNLPELGYAWNLAGREGASLPLNQQHEEIVLSERLFQMIIPDMLCCNRCRCGKDVPPFFSFCSQCGEPNVSFSEESLLREVNQPLAAVKAGCRQDHKVHHEFFARHPELHLSKLIYCIHCGTNYHASKSENRRAAKSL